MSKEEIATLRGEIEALGRELSGPARKASAKPRRRMSAREQVLAEIRDLEKRLGFVFMEDDMEEEIAPAMGPYMDDEEMAPGCGGPMMASETEAGVEDEITQDYLTEVEEEQGATGIATEPSANAAADAGPPANPEKVARWKRAAARLDRVAEHLENHGQKRLAFRIDQISDRIDAAIKKEEGE